MYVRTEVQIANLKFKNPLVLASGILGNAASLLIRAERHGAGAVTSKSITKEPRKGFENPVVVELNYGLINAIGLSNPGIDEFEKEIKIAKQFLSVPLIVSVAGKSIEEYVYVAKRAVDAGADAIELNLSCPHVKGLGLDIGQDPSLVQEIVHEVKNSISLPVFAKLSPNVNNIVEIGRAAVEGGADALIAINTIRAMAIDIYHKKPILSNRYGGLSGPAIHPIAVRCVFELYEEMEDVPIIGMGGVTTWEDAIELMLAGASAVGIGTAIYLKGFKVFKDLLNGMIRYSLREGLEALSDLIGLAHRS